MKGQGHVGLLCLLSAWYCLNQLACIHKMSFTRWRHFITTRGSNCGYPRAVLSLEQGLTIIYCGDFSYVDTEPYTQWQRVCKRTCHSLGGREVFCPWRSTTDAVAHSRRSTASSSRATSCPSPATETGPRWAADIRRTAPPTPELADMLMTSAPS